jgi:hypothetical protein
VPRLWIAGVLFGVAGLALALKDRVAAGLLGGFAGFAAIPILSLLWWPFEPPDRVDATVYVKNLGHNRIEVDAVAMDINEIDPDIILLQELTQHDAVWLRTLLPNHPHWHICQHTPISGVAVIARWPLSETGCTPRRGIAFGDVAAPGGSIWAASTHQRRVIGVERQVLIPVLGDQDLILQLDAEIPVLFADQRLDTERHARLQLIVERALHVVVGIGDQRPLIAQAHPVEAAAVFALVVFRVQLVALERQIAERHAGGQHSLLTMICSWPWRIASTMSGRGLSGPTHQVRLISTQIP